jgi:hypothetical protein
MAVLRAPLNDGTAGGELLTLGTHAECVFVLTMLCDGCSQGQDRCYEAGLLDTIVDIIKEQFDVVLEQQVKGYSWKDVVYDNMLLLAWSLLALGKLCDGQPAFVLQAVLQFDVVALLKVRCAHTTMLWMIAAGQACTHVPQCRRLLDCFIFQVYSRLDSLQDAQTML